MSSPHLDTDVIIRLLTGDDPAKQEASAALFERVRDGSLSIAAPDTVIADAVFVLTSPRLYSTPRAQVAAMLASLIRLPRFHVANRQVVLAALAVYGENKFDFGDAMIVASMQEEGATEVFSYDHDFDGISGITRQEP